MVVKTMLKIMAGSAIAASLSLPALADWAPTKPIRVIVPYGAGGGTDVVARVLTDVIASANLSPQRWVVENRSGGGGMVGMQFLADSAGDDHVIGVLTSTNMTTPLLQPDVKLHWSQLTPIANLVVDIQYLVTHNKSGIETLDDALKAAGEQAGGTRVAGAAVGTEDHLTHLMMEQGAGVKLTYVPHQNGGDVKSAIAGGHMPLAWLNPSEMAGFLTTQGGTVIPIAVAWPERTPEFPDVPAFKEKNLDVVFDAFFRGVFGPPNLSSDAKTFYAEVIRKATEHPDWTKKLADLNVSGSYIPPDEYRAALERWDRTLAALVPLTKQAK